jgi:hypothetical protein
VDGFLEAAAEVLRTCDSGRWPDIPPPRPEMPVTQQPAAPVEPVAVRLKKGAQYLAKLWQENTRCPDGWSTNCSCLAPNHFCAAKTKWLKLAKEDNRQFVQASDPYGVIGMMKVDELEATGLTITVQVPAFGKATFGPKGDFDLQLLLDAFRDPDGVSNFLQLIQLVAKERNGR